MLNYIIAINKDMKAIVVDYETDKKDCNPDIGYEEEFDDWETEVVEYIDDNYILFDSKKAFKEPGLYKVIGKSRHSYNGDGYFYYYKVENIIKIQDLKY